MASGGSLLGILYVVQVVQPLMLLVGACAVLIAGVVTGWILLRPSRSTLWVSTGLSILVAPFSLALALDGHGSAVVLGGSAVAALAIATYLLNQVRDPAASAAITPSEVDAIDERGG
jgi:hypothetical protein